MRDKFYRNIISGLKKSLPTKSLTLRKVSSGATDWATGKVTSTVSTQVINKALVLPRSFVSKNQVSLGVSTQLDESERLVIIDAKDIPENIGDLKTQDEVYIDNKRWEISKLLNADGAIIQFVIKDLEYSD